MNNVNWAYAGPFIGIIATIITILYGWATYGAIHSWRVRAQTKANSYDGDVVYGWAIWLALHVVALIALAVWGMVILYQRGF